MALHRLFLNQNMIYMPCVFSKFCIRVKIELSTVVKIWNAINTHVSILYVSLWCWSTARGCNPLPKFSKGRTSIRMSGAVVVYKCPQGKWIRGSKTIFCNGERWNDTVPTCKGNPSSPDLDFLPISNCPLPPKAHGAVAVKGFEYVTYTCVNRTVPTLGSGILRCLSNGEWDRQPVVCAST